MGHALSSSIKMFFKKLCLTSSPKEQMKRGELGEMELDSTN